MPTETEIRDKRIADRNERIAKQKAKVSIPVFDSKKLNLKGTETGRHTSKEPPFSEIDEYRDYMEDILETCKEILCSKGKDYGDDNFIEAAKVASIISGNEIKPHVIAAALIGIKLARYGNLTSTGKEPQNESVRDTILDLINYVLLMDRERQRNEKE
jgi:hypothetical protein